MPPLSSIALKKIVRPPSAVANALDWKKASGGVATAMAIDIHADRIGVVLATLSSEQKNDDSCVSVPRGIGRIRPFHQQSAESFDRKCNYNYYPSQFLCDMDCMVLDSIPLTAVEVTDETGANTGALVDIKKPRRRRKRMVSPDAKRKLAGLVHDHQVCGFIVSWPIQQDTGLMGASCGRTLWTIEQLLENGGDRDGDLRIFAPQPPYGVHQLRVNETYSFITSVYFIMSRTFLTRCLTSFVKSQIPLPQTSPNRYMLVVVAQGLRRACWVNWW